MKSREDSAIHIVEADLEELERKVRQHRMKIWGRTALCVLGAVLILAGIYFYQRYQTYDRAYVSQTYKNKNAENSHYTEFVDDILQYGKDGAVLMNEKGEEIWNQPYQMKNPMVEICKGTLAVGDKGGTSIFVLQKSGMKGEIRTPNPIETITVSEQGIVGTVLKDGENPRIVCYDALGNVLVEQKTSLKNTGYPIDIAISNDGKMLLVSYMCVKGSSVTTKIVYYDFGETGKNKKNHQAAEAEYENAVMPAVLFADHKTSVIIGDEELLFYKGRSVPKLSKKVKIKKEIKSAAYNEKYIALILKNSGKADSELCLYDLSGKKRMSVNFKGDYDHIKLSKNQIILFDGNKCSIYNEAGVHKYEGKLEATIKEIIPMKGLNKYLVISTNELQEVQLVK